MKLPNRQIRIQIASTLLAIEALIILGLSIYLIFKNFTATNTSDSKALSGEIGSALIGTSIFIFLTINLNKGKRFTFAPVILFNLIFLGVSKYMIDENLWVGAIPLISIAASLVLLVGSLVNE